MTWKLDPAHSEIGFSVRHMMIAKVRGKFTKFSGTADVDTDDLTKATVEAEIDAASIDTGDAQRDGHLRSADFLNAEAHPHIRFRSTEIAKVGDHHYRLDGHLTIRDVTKPVSFHVDVEGPAMDPWGNRRLGFSLTGEVEREDYGLTWNQALESGGVLVGKTVQIAADIELVAG